MRDGMKKLGGVLLTATAAGVGVTLAIGLLFRLAHLVITGVWSLAGPHIAEMELATLAPGFIAYLLVVTWMPSIDA